MIQMSCVHTLAENLQSPVHTFIYNMTGGSEVMQAE